MKIILASIAFALTATSAYAADAIVEEPVAVIAPDTFSWTGGYIGINAGYAGGKLKTNFNSDYSGQYFQSDSVSQKLNGFIGGVQAGYNWQYNQLVLGLETDIQGTSMKKNSRTGPYWLTEANNYADLEKKITWLGTTRARIGYLPTERLLAYVTAGVAYGGVETNVVQYSATDSSTSKTKFGYAIGAGLEYALNDNWTVKGEYLFADLGSTKHKVYEYTGFEEFAKSKFHANIIRVGLNYKF